MDAVQAAQVDEILVGDLNGEGGAALVGEHGQGGIPVLVSALAQAEVPALGVLLIPQEVALVAVDDGEALADQAVHAGIVHLGDDALGDGAIIPPPQQRIRAVAPAVVHDGADLPAFRKEKGVVHQQRLAAQGHHLIEAPRFRVPQGEAVEDLAGPLRRQQLQIGVSVEIVVDEAH